jgi:hypothetical protein
MTAVRLVPLRHFLGSVWLLLVEHMHSAFGALLRNSQAEIRRVTGSEWPDCVAVAAHWSMARFGGAAPSWHRHSTRTSIAHEALFDDNYLGRLHTSNFSKVISLLPLNGPLTDRTD